VVSHFRNKVFAWDVVNEAFNEKGRLRDSIWYNQPGIGAGKDTAYIAQAFRWAHDADPNAVLFYNEAEAEEVNPKSDAIFAMVKDFRERGVPINGIGFQMHIFNLAPNVASIAANFARFGKLGIQIHITEMDVALPVTEDGIVMESANLQRQAEIYGEIVKICLQTPGCSALQTWGVTDKYSWLGWATHKTKGAGLLFDRQYHPKPAYQAIKEALSKQPSQQN
jgi:endo-1,4-beta-xylanase